MGGWEHLKCKSANRSTELLCVVLYTLYFRKYIRTKVLCTFENGDDKGVPVATLTILATRVHVHVHVQRCTYGWENTFVRKYESTKLHDRSHSK